VRPRQDVLFYAFHTLLLAERLYQPFGPPQKEVSPRGRTA
jgi:hypothetical protein